MADLLFSLHADGITHEMTFVKKKFPCPITLFGSHFPIMSFLDFFTDGNHTGMLHVQRIKIILIIYLAMHFAHITDGKNIGTETAGYCNAA